MKKYLVKIDGLLSVEQFDSAESAKKHIIGKFEENHSLRQGDIYLQKQELIMSIVNKYKE